ncbi:PREDICTED: choline/ethanolamine kinase isoform X2 [Nicrophorus vespilloides]|nr:PREDICTED: choline/ethanolamine kinase isoform X2 [Nicrophorus vespilloides]XP_017775247.1 PREDICTED: choline/ethanolamine kinase isoform X2 [Nicrophorus vespilloides]
MQSDHKAMKELTSRICRDYLHGAWKNVTAENVGFKHISGGLSNLLYHISLPDHLVKSSMPHGEPKEVLIRVYGQTHGGERALEALITESVIFTLLSERGLGPKLHGIFPGGRIEQYMHARPLKTRELANEKYSTQIAEKMALIHSMEVPLHKDPSWLWETMERWLKSSQSQLKTNVPEIAKSLLDVDLQEEYRWLKKRMEDENCPVRFCHNDMQEGNILISEDVNDNYGQDPKFVLIDFEYCSYNYRSFDIANHFVEFMYNYTEPESPFFKETIHHYPSEEFRLNFIKTYLQDTGSGDSPMQVMREVKVFSLASHFFWTLWSIVNAETSKIPFGYWEYAVVRLNAYKRSKKDISSNQSVKRKALDP